jgi:DNA (cytosine-5)-methyltransferase 1
MFALRTKRKMRKQTVKMVRKVTHRMAELFCGPGGLALGARLSNVRSKLNEYAIESVWANDIDENACRTYQHNLHPDKPKKVVCGSVESIDLQAVPKFDGLAFGFPCNDFSMVGKQKGIHGKFGPLYRFGVEMLNIHTPKWFLAENVTGLSNANNGATFAKIIGELESCGPVGYKLNVHEYRFEQYGVPQQRHRIIIVGIRSDLNKTFKVPAPLCLSKNDYVTARQAICIPPIASSVSNQELTRQSTQVVERLRHIKPGENAWTADLPDHLKLNVKGARLSNIYRRLDPNQPAYTVTGSGGGGTHIYHWRENRALTNRERARLQSFPDYYEFLGSKEDVRRQIGMAVPPMGAKVIFEALLKTFAGIPYECIDSNFSVE